MSSSCCPYITRRFARWLLTAAVLVSSAALPLSTAWASNDGQCSDDDSSAPSSEVSSPAASMASYSLVQPGRSYSPVQIFTPCNDRAERPATYNSCFVGNPHPKSTLPDWLAQAQAEEAASAVFARINDFHAQRATAHASGGIAPLPILTPPSWYDHVIAQLEAGAPIDDGGGPRCIDGQVQDGCHSMPHPAVTVTAGSIAPVLRPTDEVEPHWPSAAADDRAQPPLVDLRVGPSAEHRDVPERPPTV